MKDLEKLQQELDKKKWLESEIARQDLTGKMFYCNVCPYQDKYLKICTATEQFVRETSQCAKMELKRKEPEKLIIKPRFSEIKEDIKDAEFMKQVNEAYEEALAYALFDVTENEVKSIGSQNLKNIKQNKKGGKKNV